MVYSSVCQASSNTLDTSACSKMDFFKFYNKCCKVFTHFNLETLKRVQMLRNEASDQGLHCCKMFCYFSLGISKSYSLIYLKLDFQYIVWGSLFSLIWVKGLRINTVHNESSTQYHVGLTLDIRNCPTNSSTIFYDLQINSVKFCQNSELIDKYTVS